MITNASSSDRPSDHGYVLAVRTAVVAAVFSAIVCVSLLADYGRRQATDPLETEQYKNLKEELANRPFDEKLKGRIRELDLDLRQHYFRQRRFTAMGAWLLLSGVVVFLVAAKSATTLRRRLPTPEPQVTPQDQETPMTGIARWSVAALAAVLVGGTVILSLSHRTELASLIEPDVKQSDPDRTVKPEKQPAPPPRDLGFPFVEEARKNWHRFRGFGGLGISAYDDVPTSWDATSGEGILWKTPVPLPGNNSPVVWNDRVFLSGASEQRRQVYCFDAGSGELLWQKDVPSTLSETLKADDISKDVGFAAPTTVTDGQRVFAIFANGDMAAFDLSGELVWSKSFGIPENSYGHASSLVIYRELLLIQFDQGGTAKEAKSRLWALDTLTGKPVYEVPRPVPNSWTTPCLTVVDGRVQLITCGDPWAIAYDPADGSEIWRADCLSQDCGPSPVASDGVVYVGNEYCVFSAIRADGKGDVTETHIPWVAEDGLPDTCSPLVTPRYLFLLATWGALTCYDSKTGDKLWEMDFDAGFASSPSWAGGRVCLFGDEGKGWIIEPRAENGQIVGQTDLGEACVTSPAFQGGRIYIRGEEHLFCIGRN